MRKIRDCNVCVIGGAGFLGSHLVNYLINKRGCQVLVLDNLISGLRKHVHEKARFRWRDIRDNSNDLAGLLIDHDIKYVFNYAAEPYIPESFERPEHFFNINALAVLKVLQACDQSDVEGILQISSAEIYGDSKGKLTEDARIEPHSTYGVSKVAADGLVQVRWKEAKTPAIALRQFNCIGERETHEYVVPEIISQISKQAPLSNLYVNLGNNSTRDFLYAGDAVKMAVELLEKGQFGEVYNMGSEEAITIYDLAKLIGQVMGARVEVKTDESRVRPWEIWHLQSDNSKLHSVIDRRPAICLEDAIRKTVDYFKSNGNKWDW